MSLPLDVLIHILSLLPTERQYGHDESVKCLTGFAAANHLFRDAAAVSTLWEPHYRARYIYCNSGKEEQRKQQFDGNWRLMYAERRRIDRTAIRLLDNVVEDRAGRYNHAATLSQFSFDIWDILDLETQQPLPKLFAEDNQLPEGVHPYALPRVYWAKSVQTVIAKGYTMQLWTQRADLSFIDAFSTLSSFFGVPPMDICAILDKLTNDCREYLIDRKCNSPLTHTDYDIAEISIAICDFMKSRGFGPTSTFHDMHNHFPHLYLTSNKQSIPISLVHIFVHIAQGLGVIASPVSFPFRVLALVSSPIQDVNDIFIDVFGKAILSAKHDLPMLLSRHGIIGETASTYTLPVQSAIPMLLRTSRNIMTSAHLNSSQRILSRNGLYIALVIQLLFAGQTTWIQPLINHAEPIDCATCIPTALVPALDNGKELQAACQKVLASEAENAAKVKKRPNGILFGFAGMIFTHRKYKYLGCIFGWDETCSADDEWIQTMQVDETLPRGRNQPFYSVYVQDGSQRYVAEDNILPPYNFSREVLAQFFNDVPKLSMLFTNIETSGGVSGEGMRARFVLGPDLRAEYPDDDAAGREWISCRTTVH